MTFKDKHIIITGGASGIGLATARLLQSKGAIIHVWDIQNAPEPFKTTTVDCTNYEQAVQAAQKLDRIDTVVHCAGVMFTGTFDNLSPERQRRIIDINLTGTINIAHATLPCLEQSKGSLIMMGSVSAFYGPPEFATYAASKAAVLSLGQALRVEYAQRGVHIGIVNPNFVNTPMLTEENREKGSLTRSRSIFLKIGNAEDVARGIANGIEKRQFLIFPDWRSHLVYWVSRYGAWSSHWMMLRTWKQTK